MKKQMIFLSIDTTGLPIKNGNNYSKPSDIKKYDNCRIVQISWEIFSFNRKKLQTNNFIVKPKDFLITNSQFHPITKGISDSKGVYIEQILDKLEEDIDNSELIISHCYDFCCNVLQSESYRSNKLGLVEKLRKKDSICTALSSAYTLKLPFDNGHNNNKLCETTRYKMPKLSELYFYCFGKQLEMPKHDSSYSVEIISECFFYLVK